MVNSSIAFRLGQARNIKAEGNGRGKLWYGRQQAERVRVGEEGSSNEIESPQSCPQDPLLSTKPCLLTSYSAMNSSIG